MINFIEHWNTVYAKSIANKHSWTQDVPETTLSILASLNLNKEVSIIDVGGGDSTLADNLLNLGYKNITVLDISENAINSAKIRLGDKEQHINWVVSDIVEFNPQQQYDVWIDRAAFHFLKNEESITIYFNLTNKYVSKNGYLIMSTFSDKGPDKCSGLEVKQYSKETITKVFEQGFNRERCVFEDHITPLHIEQNFLYALFTHKEDGLKPSHNLIADQYVKYQSDTVQNTGPSCDINNKDCCCS